MVLNDGVKALFTTFVIFLVSFTMYLVFDVAEKNGLLGSAVGLVAFASVYCLVRFVVGLWRDE